MKNFTAILIGAVLMSACGSNISESTSLNQGQQAASSFDAASFYFSLPAPDFRINSTLGATVEHRESSSHLCRRMASAGGGSFGYHCYQLMTTGVDAQNSFASLQASYGIYSVSYSGWTGGSFIDEITSGNMYGGGSMLCQKTTPQAPGSPVTYRCFRKL